MVGDIRSCLCAEMNDPGGRKRLVMSQRVGPMEQGPCRGAHGGGIVQERHVLGGGGRADPGPPWDGGGRRRGLQTS